MNNSEDQKNSWQPIGSAPKDGRKILLCEWKYIWFDGEQTEDQELYVYTGFYNIEAYHGPRWECSEYEVFDHDPILWKDIDYPVIIAAEIMEFEK